ncbi:hypothetical protein D3C77_196450 [compost metagenome]
MQGGGGLHQLLLVAAVFHHVHEGGDGTLRSTVSRDPRFIEQASTLLGRVFSRPVGQYVETPGPGVLLEEIDQIAGQGCTAGGKGGGVDQQNGIGPVSLQQIVQRGSVGLHIGIAAYVQGRHGHLATARQQHVCGHVGQTAPVGEDGESLPLEGQGVAQGFDGGKQLMGIPDPQHSGPADGGVIDVVEAVGRIVAAALEHQNGLVAGGGAGGGEKVTGIVQLVHVDQDGAGCPVAGELIQQLAEVDVAVIPKRDEGREADLPLLGPVEDGGADRRRLGEEGHLAGGSGYGGEAGIDALPGQ